MISTLTPEEAQLFYELWIPFQEHMNFLSKVKFYSNQKVKLDFWDMDEEQTRKYILSRWPELVDLYLQTTELPPEHREIVESWKRAVSGEFLLERHLKKGSSFVALNSKMVYIVKGIDLSWQEMFAELPVRIETTLLPFRDKIIYDGTIVSSKPVFDRWTKASGESFYSVSKQLKLIVTSL